MQGETSFVLIFIRIYFYVSFSLNSSSFARSFFPLPPFYASITRASLLEISRWDHSGFVLETLPGGDLFLCFCCVMLGFSLVVVVGREEQRERRGENRRRRGKMFVDC
jgi:hypothetical protein